MNCLVVRVIVFSRAGKEGVYCGGCEAHCPCGVVACSSVCRLLLCCAAREANGAARLSARACCLLARPALEMACCVRGTAAPSGFALGGCFAAAAAAHSYSRFWSALPLRIIPPRLSCTHPVLLVEMGFLGVCTVGGRGDKVRRHARCSRTEACPV